MKKYISLGLLTLLIISTFVSCKDFLDTKVDNNYGSNITWTLPGKAEGVIMDVYESIMAQPDNWAGNNFLDVATDNAVTNDFTSGLYHLVAGGLTPQNNPIDNWKTAYQEFYEIHLFLENGLGSNIQYDLFDKNNDAIYRARLKGEAYFLRAWWGADLLKRFGGVTADGQALGYVIVLKSLTQADQTTTNQLPRNTYEECVKQILRDCDSAIYYLPIDYSGVGAIVGANQQGRATKKSAYGLKSRVCLFAASPAYQPEGTFAISPDSITNKWIRAAQSAQEAITKGTLGAYSLFGAADLSGAALEKTTPADFLFRIWKNNNAMESRNYPPYFWGQGKTNPSQNLVDAFPTKDGFPITDPRSSYSAQNPYVNRDNRFDLTVYYNGKTFDNRPLEIYTDSLGVPGRDAAGYEYRNTRTGYYVRKWMSVKSSLLYNATNLGTANDFHQHALLRRAEVWLNLAEASNEAFGPKGIVPGCAQSAYQIIAAIRTAAGIASTTYLDEVANAGKDAFRKLILNERRLEFAFENMRYFDLRRHKLPLNEPVYGVSIIKRKSGLEYKGTSVDPLQKIVVEERKLNDAKYIYSPLPYDELIKNPKLINNKGW